MAPLASTIEVRMLHPFHPFPRSAIRMKAVSDSHPSQKQRARGQKEGEVVQGRKLDKGKGH